MLTKKWRRRFGRRLAAMRADKGWSQADLARVANVGQPMVSMIERAVRVPSLPVLLALQEALRCEWVDLLDARLNVWDGLEYRRAEERRIIALAGQEGHTNGE